MFSFFLLQLGVGIPACTGLVPGRLVGRGFFLLNGSIGLACLGSAYALRGGSGLPVAGHVLMGTAVGFLSAYLCLQLTPRRRSGLPLLLPGLLAGCWLLLRWSSGSPPAGSSGGSPALLGIDALLGALLLGSVLAAMNLGHWYLVTPALPIGILKRLTLMFLLALTARILLMAFVSFLVWNGALELTPGFLLRNGVFLAQRILFGILVPALLSVMIWKTVRIRSTQSATGILYVAVFFILMGELVSRHLRFLTGVPF